MTYHCEECGLEFEQSEDEHNEMYHDSETGTYGR